MKSRPAGKRQPWALFLGLTLLAPELALSQQSDAPPERTSTSSATFRAYIKAAAQLYEELEYEAALNVLGAARSQAVSKDELAEASLYEAIVLADLGRRPEALKVFSEALRLKPDAKLPVRVAPKVVKDFETVQGQSREEQAPTQASASPQPSPVITDAPTLPSTTSPMDTPTIAQSLPAPKSSTIPLLTTPSPDQSRFTVKQITPALAGAGVVAGGVGFYLTSRSQDNFSKARKSYTRTQESSFQDIARAQSRGAVVMYSAAAAAIVGAIVTFMADSDD